MTVSRNMHIERNWPKAARRRAYIDRFWTKVDRKGADDCWPYLGHKGGGGYGHFYIGHPIMAHRFAYEAEHGEGSANGLKVLHKCDNPPCCNPSHLFLGTPLDNMNDKHAKGRERYIKGDECSWAKLTEADVREIRKLIAAKVEQKGIAKKYGVTPSLITYIKNGRAWAHVQ